MEENIFFRKFKERFDRKENSENFDFSKFIWSGWNGKSTVICKEHGEFSSTPYKLLINKFGCMKCALKGKSKPKIIKKRDIPESVSLSVKNSIIEKYKSNINIQFDFSNMKSMTVGSVGIFCIKHNYKREISARELLQRKEPCVYCSNERRIASKIHDYDNVISEMNKRHEGKYIYPESNRDIYVNKRSKISILCPIHGEFIKTVQKHLSGQGCPECSVIDVKRRGELPGFYTEKSLLLNPEMANKPSILYYVKVGEFYKIGVTSDIKSRMRSLKSLFKLNIELIDFVELTFIDGIRLESKILEKYSEFRVIESEFKTTELFSKNVLNSKIEIDRI